MQDRADWEAKAAAREAAEEKMKTDIELIVGTLAGLAVGNMGFKMVDGVYVIVPCAQQ